MMPSDALTRIRSIPLLKLYSNNVEQELLYLHEKKKIKGRLTNKVYFSFFYTSLLIRSMSQSPAKIQFAL